MKELLTMPGNRRFLILYSNLPKFGYVRSVRGEKLSDDNVIAQIWAEVYEHYKELFKKELLTRHNERCLRVD